MLSMAVVVARDQIVIVKLGLTIWELF